MKKLAYIFLFSFASLQLKAQPPQLVADLSAGPSNTNFFGAIAYNGKLIFNALNQLWITDGTTAGTQLLMNFPYVNGEGVPNGFKELNNKIYFVCSDSIHGYELWLTDGTAAGTQMLLDINTNLLKGSIATNYSDYLITVMNGKMYFSANDGTHGYELWVSDGTVANTHLIKDINPIPDSGSIYNNYGSIAAISGQVMFSANDGIHGFELWVTDGTASGTAMVKDINNVDTLGSRPTAFLPFNDKVIFYTTTGTTTQQNDIYITDGTAAGTTLLLPNMYNFFDHAIVNNTFYFCANSNTQTSLWASDGTVGGTTLLKDSIKTNGAPINSHSYRLFLTGFNNKLYFGCNGLLNINVELWESDGTPIGTHALKHFNPGNTVYPASLTVAAGALYFKFFDTMRVNLFYFDGTDSNGIYKINEPNANSSVNSFLSRKCAGYPITPVGSSLYFPISYDSTIGLELYKLGINTSKVEAQHHSEATLSIFPNPGSSNIFVYCDEDARISVYDMAGKLVSVGIRRSKRTNELDISLLAPGTYIVVAWSNASGWQHGEFVKD